MIRIDEQFTLDTADVVKALNDKFTGAKVKLAKTGQEGTITSVVSVRLTENNTPDIEFSADFSGQQRKFMLLMATRANFLAVDTALLAEVDICMPQLQTAAEGLKNRIHDVFVQQEAERAAERKAKADEERRKKLEQKAISVKRNLLNLADTLSNSKETVNSRFYTDLGYLAKHTKKISAAMPDYLQSWFEREFGEEVEKRIVDSSKLTSGGYSMQWSLSMKIDLDTNENMPADLLQYLSTQDREVKQVADTSFVFNIVKNHGFKFGKVQNIDEIRNMVPADMKEAFEIGYNLK